MREAAAPTYTPHLDYSPTPLHPLHPRTPPYRPLTPQVWSGPKEALSTDANGTLQGNVLMTLNKECSLAQACAQSKGEYEGVRGMGV